MARRQLREHLDPENCMCYQAVVLREVTEAVYLTSAERNVLSEQQYSGLSPEPVDKCTHSLGESAAKADVAAHAALFKNESTKTLCPPEMMIPLCGSIEFGADYDRQALPWALNERLAIIRCGESLGIHGLSWSAYHACDGYSASQVLLVQSGGLAALGWYKNAPRDTQEPVALSVSAAIRAAILEPVRFAADYAAGAASLSDDDYRRARLMHDSALANPVLSSLLQRGVASPSVFYRTRGGVLLKVRPDWIGELDGLAYILNVKTVDESCDFGELVERRGYHVRTAFYNFVVGRVFGIEPELAFCTISCRKQCGRHLVEMRSLDEEDVLEGGVVVRRVITALEAMLPGGASVGIGVVRRPFWARMADKYRRGGGRYQEEGGSDI